MFCGKLKGGYKMITQKQRLERRNGIGGSDMPIILGLSNYSTPYQLYLEKTGLVDSTYEEGPLQYWGHRIEAVIRREFSKRNKVKVENHKDTKVHPMYEFLRGNIDGYIPSSHAVFEAKCSNQFMAHLWGEKGTDAIPLEYLVQVAFYCCILNCESAYIAVLIGGNDYREFKYERDLELEKTIIDSACRFWDYVKNNTPPPAINQSDLVKMFPKNSPNKSKIINTQVNQDLTSYKETKASIKDLESIATQSRFNILQYMEDCESLTDDSGKPLATWISNKKGIRTFLLKGAKND